MIYKLENIDEKALSEYRATGESQILDNPTKNYIDEVGYAAQLIHRSSKSIIAIAKNILQMFPSNGLTLASAKNRVYDAINYFHLNNNVKNEAWDNYFALEHFPKLIELALTQKNTELAFKIMIKQHEILTRHDEDLYDPLELIMKPQIISPELGLDRIGTVEMDLRKLYEKTRNLVGKFEISEDEKKRILTETANELNIQDADIIDE